jgi:hypothetical protein
LAVAVRGLSGDFARTLAHCAAVVGSLEADLLNEVFGFMFHRLSQTDDMKVIFAFCVGHVDHMAVKSTEQIDAQLAVCESIIIPSHDGVIKHDLTAYEVQSVVNDIALAFNFVPCWHV